jgi:hypothetical protein
MLKLDKSLLTKITRLFFRTTKKNLNVKNLQGIKNWPLHIQNSLLNHIQKHQNAPENLKFQNIFKAFERAAAAKALALNGIIVIAQDKEKISNILGALSEDIRHLLGKYQKQLNNNIGT